MDKNVLTIVSVFVKVKRVFVVWTKISQLITKRNVGTLHACICSHNLLTDADRSNKIKHLSLHIN